MAASNLRIQEANKKIPVYQTRAMRQEFVERFELMCNTSSTVLNEMYRFVSGDSSACANSVNCCPKTLATSTEQPRCRHRV